MRRRPPLTKDRLQAIIDTLNEATIEDPPGTWPAHEGALQWATTKMALDYHEKAVP